MVPALTAAYGRPPAAAAAADPTSFPIPGPPRGKRRRPFLPRTERLPPIICTETNRTLSQIFHGICLSHIISVVVVIVLQEPGDVLLLVLVAVAEVEDVPGHGAVVVEERVAVTPAVVAARLEATRECLLNRY